MEIFCLKEDDSHPICRFAAVEQIWGQCSREGLGASEPAEPELHCSTRRKGKVITAERLLAPCASLTCFLMRFLFAWTSDSGCCQLLKLVWPSDYYPLLLLHVGINSTSRGGLESMKHDYTAVGVIRGHRGSSGGLGPAGKGEETRK